MNNVEASDSLKTKDIKIFVTKTMNFFQQQKKAIRNQIFVEGIVY